MAKLIIEECNQTSKVKVYHKIDHFPVTIGRSFNNTLISDDPYMSEVHLQIEKGDDDEQWLIRDCESENGCFLSDGRQITGETLLSSGDSICMGDSSFHFYTAHHPVEAPLKWHPVPLWIKKSVSH